LSAKKEKEKRALDGYLNRSFQLKQDGLRDEDLTGLGTQVTDLGLEELDLLAWTAASHLQEAIDYRIEVDFMLIRHFGILASPRDGARTKSRRKRRRGARRREEGGGGSCARSFCRCRDCSTEVAGKGGRYWLIARYDTLLAAKYLETAMEI
jgi:hypothetical protein